MSSENQIAKKYSTAQVRKLFLDYFSSKGHTIESSSALIPHNDPTLLFTNAGMVQFKDVFLGLEKRNFVRAATSQRCVRAGGKHNDLENVGYTARHHTFFEMLGNFSFGDYFKKEAIEYAWEFLTQVIQLPPENLWITVFEDDEEAADLWLNHIKVSPQRFSRIGAKDNFWSMGEIGPCGPCSEIFYDHGEDVPGGPPGSPDEDGDRYIEIWNLVFMQYDRDQAGTLKPLPHPSVDTGMGLERLTAVLQQVHNNYDIDLFQFLIKACAKLTQCNDLSNKSLRVISDHIRACSFLIMDGVIPSNEGRGYVLRRIIRRAIRHGHKLGKDGFFFSQLVSDLADVMGQAYPQLIEQKDFIAKVLLQEEESFSETLNQGMQILNQAIPQIKDTTISGELAFKLYGTYGFPIDLTADIAREHELKVDHASFEQLMEQERQRARSSGDFKAQNAEILSFNTDNETQFIGYDAQSCQTKITDIFVEQNAVNKLIEGQNAILVLEQTPFYAESGGQVGDLGSIKTDEFEFIVNDTQKAQKHFLHIGKLLKGELTRDQLISAEIDTGKREQIVAHHSATHLLHAALRKILGEHVQQKGSLVDAERLRFDFSHFELISNEQLIEIENLVNRHIRLNHAVTTDIMSIDEAKASGAMALFGEKYDEKVRVLGMGNFSRELCGGTHVANTGDIGLFKITSEAGIAAGVRRIEAVAGEKALIYQQQQEIQLKKTATMLKTATENVAEKVNSMLEQYRQLEKECERLKAKLASRQGDSLLEQVIDIHNTKLLAVQLDNMDAKNLRETMDQLKNKLGSCAIVLASSQDNKVSLVAGVSKDRISLVKAGELVNFVASQVGGKGGGRPDMAMAGGSQPEKLPQALQSVADWLTQKLAG